MANLNRYNLSLILFAALSILSENTAAKQIALSFDDAPVGRSYFYSSKARTEELIKKLKLLEVPQVAVFANPCKNKDPKEMVGQLSLYQKAGHIIGNHTCSHPRYDEVGFEAFTADIVKANQLLAPLLPSKKLFRFPYLNEGKSRSDRDRMRTWLTSNGYQNAFVSIDSDDTTLTSKLKAAQKSGIEIKHKEVSALFVRHILESSQFYDSLAVKHLGYSPKHILLLHEIDGTVMYIEELVKGLRSNGWTIIAVSDAYSDPHYQKALINTHSGNGIIDQIAYEKTNGESNKTFFDYAKLEEALNQILK